MNKHKAIVPFLILAGLAAILWAADLYAHLTVPGVQLSPTRALDVYFISRWLAIAALIYYGFKRKSLTAWIVLGMVIGAELGHDAPKFAANLQVLSGVFLRLIKTIVAPLIFSTLVVGIAGHS